MRQLVELPTEHTLENARSEAAMTLRATLLGHLLLLIGASAGGYVLLSFFVLKKMYPQLSAPVFPLLGMAFGLFLVGTCVAINIALDLLITIVQRKDVLGPRTRAQLAHLVACPLYFAAGFVLSLTHILLR